MNKIGGEQLARHVRGWQGDPAFPVYLVSGDEPLLVQEAVDTLRSAARQTGFTERQSWQADAQFDWLALTDAGNSLSLFATRQLLADRLRNRA